jgi:hypothetical protein
MKQGSASAITQQITTAVWHGKEAIDVLDTAEFRVNGKYWYKMLGLEVFFKHTALYCPGTKRTCRSFRLLSWLYLLMNNLLGY